MFRKKHSEINIQVQNHSPFRKVSMYSPLTRTPERINLSPMKNGQKYGHSTKSPRKQFTCDVGMGGKVMGGREINFQSQLQCLGNTLFSEYQSTNRYNTNKIPVRTALGYEGSTFSNISNYQTSDRQMKESKKIFSNAVSKMNSGKKKGDNPSNQNSVFEESCQYAGENYQHQPQSLPIASFKALRQIKMIESVHPLPPPPLLQKSSSKKMSNHENSQTRPMSKGSSNKQKPQPEEAEIVEEFRSDQKNKRQRIVELINQSFSINPPPIDCPFKEVEIKPSDLQLGNNVKILESMYIDESLEFKSLNTLLTKLGDESGIERNNQEIQGQSVKVSMQSAKNSLTMNPFL